MNTALKMLLTLGRGSNGANVVTYASKVLALTPIAYWQMTETSGTNAADSSGNGYNGTYRNTPTLAAIAGAGPTMGRAPLFGGTSNNDIYSAGFAGAFNKAELTVSLWIRNNGSWTTGQRFVSIRTDANNRILIYVSGTNTIQLFYRAGGASPVSQDMASLPNNTWMHIALTVSIANNQFKAYLNGTQVGSTQAVSGVWAGALGSTNCALGAEDNSGSSGFAGYLAQAAVFSSPLVQAGITVLATAL